MVWGSRGDRFKVGGYPYMFLVNFIITRFKKKTFFWQYKKTK
jgi:hypothetical protein